MRASIAPWPVAFASFAAALAPSPAVAGKFNCSYWEEPGGVRIYADPFVIFFDWDSDAITPQAARILDQAASVYSPIPHCAIMIVGHADRSGSTAYNSDLAERRAKSVAAYLRRRGAGWQTLIESHGESRPLVETPDGVRERQNRRVEMVIVPRRARQ